MDPRVRILSQLYLKLADQVDATANAKALAVAGEVLAARLPGVTDVIPGYTTVLIEFDPQQISRARLDSYVRDVLNSDTPPAPASSTVNLDVVYDGPDLAELAAATGLEISEVIRRHSSVGYRAYAAGFTPGFAFLGDVDPAIRRPRRTTPRTQVPAGSVGIADGQTGVYPSGSPGGWNLIGRVVEAVYDPSRSRPALIEAGDTVVFSPVSAGARILPPAPLELLPEEPRYPLYLVRKPGLLDLVMDQGRFLAGRFGFARGGPLDPVSASIANALVANAPSAPLLEMNYAGPTLEVLRDSVVAFAGAGVRLVVDGQEASPYVSTYVRAGQVLTFPPAAHGVRGYLAVAGGIESKTFMGSASVDVRGLIGRPLQAEDVLGAQRPAVPRAGFEFTPHHRDTATLKLRLLPGPQYDAELLAELTSRPVRLEHADRLGARLSSTGATGGGVISEGNPLGAVQVTGGGDPIILLNDRGTMGGYTKPALVDPRDLPKLAQARDGTEVRFQVAPRAPKR